MDITPPNQHNELIIPPGPLPSHNNQITSKRYQFRPSEAGQSGSSGSNYVRLEALVGLLHCNRPSGGHTKRLNRVPNRKPCLDTQGVLGGEIWRRNVHNTQSEMVVVLKTTISMDTHHLPNGTKKASLSVCPAIHSQWDGSGGMKYHYNLFIYYAFDTIPPLHL